MQPIDILSCYPYKKFLENNYTDTVSEKEYSNILNQLTSFITKQNITVEIPPLINRDECSTLLSFRINYTPKEAANFSWILASQLIEKDLDRSNLLITFQGYNLD